MFDFIILKTFKFQSSFFNKSKKLSFFQVYTYRKYFWHFWILDRDLGGHPILRIQIHITWMKFYYCTLLNENLLLSSLFFFRKGNLKTVDLQQFYQNIFENLFFKFLKTKFFFKFTELFDDNSFEAQKRHKGRNQFLSDLEQDSQPLIIFN